MLSVSSHYLPNSVCLGSVESMIDCKYFISYKSFTSESRTWKPSPSILSSLMTRSCRSSKRENTVFEAVDWAQIILLICWRPPTSVMNCLFPGKLSPCRTAPRHSRIASLTSIFVSLSTWTARLTEPDLIANSYACELFNVTVVSMLQAEIRTSAELWPMISSSSWAIPPRWQKPMRIDPSSPMSLFNSLKSLSISMVFSSSCAILPFVSFSSLFDTTCVYSWSRPTSSIRRF